MAKDDIDELLLRASNGDEVAFRSFYRQTAPALLAFLLRMLRDRHEAEDVLQESMVVAWNRAGEYDPAIASAKTWITTIARRRALDILRRHKRQSLAHSVDADDIRLILGNDAADASPEPLSKATTDRLEFCLGEIGPDAANSIRYAYMYGLTNVEIAAYLDRAVGTVKSWIQRGLRSLKKCMEG